MGYAHSEGGVSVRSTTSRSGPRKRKDKKTQQNDHHDEVAATGPAKASFTVDMVRQVTCIMNKHDISEGN